METARVFAQTTRIEVNPAVRLRLPSKLSARTRYVRSPFESPTSNVARARLPSHRLNAPVACAPAFSAAAMSSAHSVGVVAPVDQRPDARGTEASGSREGALRAGNVAEKDEPLDDRGVAHDLPIA